MNAEAQDCRWRVRFGSHACLAGAACALLAAIAVCLLPTAGAAAKVIHESQGSFAVDHGEGAPHAGAGFALSVAINDSSGDLYVANMGYEAGFPSAVYEFTAAGKYTGLQITGAETPQKSFALVSFASATKDDTSAIAVDNAEGTGRGDLYVADIAHGLVDKFSAEGKFICQITGKATPSSSECDKAGSSTIAGGSEGFTPTGIAVGPAGDLYVADVAHKVIDEFGPEGEYLATIKNPAGEEPISDPTSVAVAPGGALYIVNGGNLLSAGSDLVQYASGKFTKIAASAPRSVAVESSNGHIFTQINEGSTHQVQELTANERPVNLFGQMPSIGYVGVATAGSVYIARQEGFYGRVDLFGPDIVLPNVAIEKVTAVEESSATVNGNVGPDTTNEGSEVARCTFEYVTQAHFEKEGFTNASGSACSPSTPYSATTSVSANLGGLAASTTYHVRLAATNNAYPAKTSYSESPVEEVFTTKGPPTVEGELVAAITRTGATLEAKINPKGYATEYWFEYGESEAYGTKVPLSPVAIGEGQSGVAVSRAITGLKVGAGYHFRVVAKSSHGTVYGADEAFSAVPAAGIEYQLALPGPHTATIKARIDPKMGLPALKGATSCVLQYLTAAQREASGWEGAATLPCNPASIEPGSEGQNVMLMLGGLAQNTVYEYRLIAANEAGTTTQEEQVATFGLASGGFSAALLGEGAEPYVQAGGHPDSLTTVVQFVMTAYRTGAKVTGGIPKDIEVQLPAGAIGNPSATAKCTAGAADSSTRGECSSATQVGTIDVIEEEGGVTGEEVVEKLRPLFNVMPPPGVAAEFASSEINGGLNAVIQAKVRTGEGYGIEADSLNLPTIGTIKAVKVTMWGVPSDPSHDQQRICGPGESGTAGSGHEYGCQSGEPPRPFLTAPSFCAGGDLVTTVLADSYQAPGQYVSATGAMPAMTGCEEVPFSPGITVAPESSSSDSPTGLEVRLYVPQNENPNGIAEADLKNAEVKLPAGVTLNPSSANGLVGCPLLSGKEAHPGVTGIDLEDGEAAKCPNASKIGSVRIKTPLLEEELEGGIYVAQQNANPFKSLLALYIAAEAPERGVVLKLAGHVQLNPSTGQLSTTFDENPQLPFEELKLDFFGGERAPLATPRTCGSYTTTSLLEPWSHQPAPGEAAGTPDASPESPFSITSGPGGSACDPAPFAPGFAAGTVSNQAAGYSSFVMNLTRRDGEQRLSTVAMMMPKGLLGMISKVTPCGNAQAEAGDCPAASKIGHVVVQAGVGSEPVLLPQPGKGEDPVFLTEKYGGAPFGLSIVVPAEAGPFNLGTVVVRARIEVNPHTAQVGVISNPMPQMLQGIPLDVQAIHVSVNRPEFMFNPTSCNAMIVNTTVGSAEGASSAVSSRFQAAGCLGLPFHPSFSAIVHAHHSRNNGEYLHVIVRSGPGQANIGRVHVALPVDLPSRESTLKKACTEAQFNKNPEGCPAGSIVGTATAYTPMLPVPLRGKAMFVSHASRGFPDLEVVLHGDGVTVNLVGNTFINSKGVTFSTFANVPDVPVTRFDLVLPAGPHSALNAIGNLCRHHPVMPTTITGQNGAVISQQTKVAVTGCRPAVEVLKRSVKRDSATIVVHVPSAGRLIASGRGIAPVVRKLGKPGRTTRIVVHLNRRYRQVIARHHGRRLRIVVHLRFKPRHGHPLTAKTAVLMR